MLIAPRFSTSYNIHLILFISMELRSPFSIESKALHNILPTTIEDLNNLNLSKISAFTFEHDNKYTYTAAVKLNQYTSSPYEFALFPTHRKVSLLRDLTLDEGVSLMRSVYDLSEAMSVVRGIPDKNSIISVNQHFYVEGLPSSIQRENDEVFTRVQTVDQLHIHVAQNVLEIGDVIRLDSLRQERKMEIIDPYTQVFSEIATGLIKDTYEGIFTGFTVNTKSYPLGLTLHLEGGLKTICNEDFFKFLVKFEDYYEGEYRNISRCLVSNEEDKYGMPLPLTEEERLKNIQEYFASKDALSDKSKRLLYYIAKHLKPFEEEQHPYYTFVKHPAFTLSVYQDDQGEAYVNIQPRIVSRGNALSAFGIHRNGYINSSPSFVVYERNVYSQIHEELQETSAYSLKKEGLTDGYVPHLDEKTIDAALWYGKPELSHFNDDISIQSYLRSILRGEYSVLHLYESDPGLNERYKLEVEEIIPNLLKKNGIVCNLLNENIEFMRGSTTNFISSEEQRANLEQFISKRKGKFWSLTREESSLTIAQSGCLYDYAGNLLYSEKEEEEALNSFRTELNSILDEPGCLAFYGRAKRVGSVKRLMGSTTHKIASPSEIIDLLGTRLVFEDLAHVETCVNQLQEKFGERILLKRNLFARPYEHSPYFKAIILYIKLDNEQMVELQVCTKNTALLSSVGHALEFKPNVRKYRCIVSDLLNVPESEVTSEHIRMLTWYPFKSIRSRLLTEEWLDYLKTHIQVSSAVEEIIRREASKKPQGPNKRRAS